MGSGSNSPRKLKKFKDSTTKTKAKETFTHMEFVDYTEPFFEPLKEKHWQFLQTITQPKNFNLKKEVYMKWIDQLKDKLCSCYVFNDVEFEKVHFDSPLVLNQNIKKISHDKTKFAEENEILESYRLSGFTSLLNEYKDQVNRNNQRRKAIASLIEERSKYYSYFRAFDLIKKELEDIQRKRIQSKKKKRGEFENQTIREYLNRIEEFFNAFGTPDQFEEMDYSDIFTNGVTSVEKMKELQFFE